MTGFIEISGLMGDVCSADNDCVVVAHSHCENAACRCESGYVQSQDDTTCVLRK